ncbi:MAG: glycosyltransferase [Bryobacteraceae bacterium]
MHLLPSRWRRTWQSRSSPVDDFPLRPYDVFVFPVIDWNYRFQRPQQLSTELARRGRRVFYFSAELLPDVGIRSPEVDQIAPNVFLVGLPGSYSPPDIYKDIPNELQLAAMEFGIRCLKEHRSIGATLSIVDYPFWAPLVQRIANTVTLYDCMDDYSSFANAGRPVSELEPRLFEQADLVVCSSNRLQARASRAGVHSSLIRNAVDPIHYQTPPSSLAIPCDGRTVGYHGAIAEWIDLDLLAYAALRLPDKHFVLVGGVQGVDTSPLAALPNTTLVGEVPYQRLPEYLHAFDVCVLPYRSCHRTLAADPLKLYEYLAAGKPVVATRLPEIERLSQHITLTETREEFVQGIKDGFQDHTASKGAARQAFARSHTWSQRCDAMEALVQPFFPKVSLIILAHNNLSFTESTLRSIERFSGYPNLEIILVDNGSTDGTPAYCASWAAARSCAKAILNPVNSGFAAGNNLGARASTGDYLLLLNNDVYVTDGWISGLLYHFRQDRRLGLLGPVTNASGNESVIDINYADMEEMAIRARAYTRQRRRCRTPMRAIHFFCVMIPRSVWNLVGELDEGFGLGMFEDDDYSARVCQAGYQIACAEDVFVHHHQAASFGQLPDTVQQELFLRNRRYFESKWGPWTPPVYREEVRANGVGRERVNRLRP